MRLALLLAVLAAVHANTLQDYINQKIDKYLKVAIKDAYYQSNKMENMDEQCTGAGVQCAHCDHCYPGGWCLKDGWGHVTKQCICMYGWTGARATFKQNTNNAAWGKNRIIARDCNTACHYTHDHKDHSCARGGGQVTTTPKKPYYYDALKEKVRDYVVKRMYYYNQNTVAPETTPNTDMCVKAGVQCGHCDLCHPGGWCLKDNNGKLTDTCICMYGWTGKYAKYLPNTNDKEWGQNRIVAKDCDRPCHYTHDYRDESCVKNIEMTKKPYYYDEDIKKAIKDIIKDYEGQQQKQKTFTLPPETTQGWGQQKQKKFTLPPATTEGWGQQTQKKFTLPPATTAGWGQQTQKKFTLPPATTEGWGQQTQKKFTLPPVTTEGWGQQTQKKFTLPPVTTEGWGQQTQKKFTLPPATTEGWGQQTQKKFTLPPATTEGWGQQTQKKFTLPPVTTEGWGQQTQKKFTKYYTQGPVKTTTGTDQCKKAGVECGQCSHCWPGGWCLKDNNGQLTKQCICMYGWTGKDAKYLPNTNDKEWGQNRIVAKDCDRPCHYTHDYRSDSCLKNFVQTTANPWEQKKKGQQKKKFYYDIEKSIENIVQDMEDSFKGQQKQKKFTLPPETTTPTPVTQGGKKKGHWYTQGPVKTTARTDQCKKAGVDCGHCDLCRPGGWCLKDIYGKLTDTCICMYGWTGKDAKYLPNTNDKEWGQNRIVAKDCDRPCHYTHDYRSDTCLKNTVKTTANPWEQKKKGQQKKIGQQRKIGQKNIINDAVEEILQHLKDSYKGQQKQKTFTLPPETTTLTPITKGGQKKGHWYTQGPVKTTGGTEQCKKAGVECGHCSECRPGGWCLKDKNGRLTKQCICMYGWTGKDARYIADTDNKEWGKNRIVARDCKKACHYTHDYRGSCAKGGHIEPKKCDPNVCEANGRGKCVNGECRCCRGWTSSKRTVYHHDHYHTTNVNDQCDKECPYLGFEIRNPFCKKPTDITPPCHPKCESLGGRCETTTGRCHCCEGWTGADASYEADGTISVAGVCDVYCSYTRTRKNLLCVNPSFVKRSTTRL